MTSENTTVLLDDRGVVAVDGPDAAKLLQGLVTNDVGLLETQPAIHAGLLSPQAKILFEFFVVKAPDGLLLDVAREKAAELVKRLTLYKLRAAVTLRDLSDRSRVFADFGAEPHLDHGIIYRDPRLAELGWRAILPADGANTIVADAGHYHAHRIALGVPEGGRDYAFGDAFPHEALFDQLNGVSFTKGCYVGQEVVSRMEHRGIARKRIVPVVASGGTLKSGDAVRAGEVEIGTVGSVCGARGLALLRLDRAEEFAAKGVPLVAGDATLRLDIPRWTHFKPLASPA